jgi:hypothetical protein
LRESLTTQVLCQAIDDVPAEIVERDAGRQCRAGNGAACMVMGTLGGDGIVTEMSWSVRHDGDTRTVETRFESKLGGREPTLDPDDALSYFARACALEVRRGCDQAAAGLLATAPDKARGDYSLGIALADCRDGDATACSLLMSGWNRSRSRLAPAVHDALFAALEAACEREVDDACSQASVVDAHRSRH